MSWAVRFCPALAEQRTLEHWRRAAACGPIPADGASHSSGPPPHTSAIQRPSSGRILAPGEQRPSNRRRAKSGSPRDLWVKWRPEGPRSARRLRRLRRLRKFAEVAQNASDAPPPSAEGCWLSRSAALQGGRRARHHRIQAAAPPARGIRGRCQLHRRGGDRDRAPAAPPARLLGMRPDRPRGSRSTTAASSAGATSISAPTAA